LVHLQALDFLLIGELGDCLFQSHEVVEELGGENEGVAERLAEDVFIELLPAKCFLLDFLARQGWLTGLNEVVDDLFNEHINV